MAVSLHFLWDGIFEAKVMQSRWQMPKRQEEAHRGIKEDVREKSDPSGSADFAGWAKHSTLEANSAHQPDLLQVSPRKVQLENIQGNINYFKTQTCVEIWHQGTQIC